MEEISFVKLLNKLDIIKILEINNLELNNNAIEPLSIDRYDNGEWVIFAKCKRIDNQENKLNEISAKTASKLFKHTQHLALLGSIIGNNSYSFFDYTELIEIKDFTMFEVLSFKNDNELKEHIQTMTKNYHKYMKNKFGDIYTQKAKEYFKSLQQSTNNDEIEK